MAKRRNLFADDASKYASASSETTHVDQRVLPLAAVRHKNSPLIIAEDKTHSDVKGQVNPNQASGDRLHLPGFKASGDLTCISPAVTRDSRVTEPEVSELEDYFFSKPEESNMLRRHLDATSPMIPMSGHRETGCSQNMMT